MSVVFRKKIKSNAIDMSKASGDNDMYQKAKDAAGNVRYAKTVIHLRRLWERILVNSGPATD